MISGLVRFRMASGMVTMGGGWMSSWRGEKGSMVMLGLREGWEGVRRVERRVPVKRFVTEEGRDSVW